MTGARPRRAAASVERETRRSPVPAEKQVARHSGRARSTGWVDEVAPVPGCVEQDYRPLAAQEVVRVAARHRSFGTASEDGSDQEGRGQIPAQHMVNVHASRRPMPPVWSSPTIRGGRWCLAICAGTPVAQRCGLRLALAFTGIGKRGWVAPVVCVLAWNRELSVVTSDSTAADAVPAHVTRCASRPVCADSRLVHGHQ
jgi:hypothetical protein